MPALVKLQRRLVLVIAVGGAVGIPEGAVSEPTIKRCPAIYPLKNNSATEDELNLAPTRYDPVALFIVLE
jgi:hypothetical protein